MKLMQAFALITMLVLAGCGRPSAPESPDPSTYGQTIQPFHQIPAGDQEGGGKARGITEKSAY